MTQQTVGDVMTQAVAYIPPTTTVTLAARMMRDDDVGDVVIADDGRVRGVITDRDIVVRAVAGQLDPDTTTVGEICSEDLAVVRPDTPITDAVQKMRDAAVRRLPVVDDDGNAQGFVSIGDLAVTADPDSALSDISAAPPNL
ncbi:MAG: CBS domain-containing protein [Streptosporangiales bacterium]|nr:CBS domain-containing protein [Streptosporangiales bacterium]MBO0890133.1 CBS domain-containing protein [Acidothermales bacterium]